MKLPESITQALKPAIWGAIGGAAVAMVVGFSWGGWVTGGTVEKMTAASAEAAIVKAFAPLCVAQAEQQPDKIALLKKESSWQFDSFVINAGWVTNVSEKYRSAVAEVCASTVVKAMNASAAKPAG